MVLKRVRAVFSPELWRGCYRKVCECIWSYVRVCTRSAFRDDIASVETEVVKILSLALCVEGGLHHHYSPCTRVPHTRVFPSKRPSVFARCIMLFALYVRVFLLTLPLFVCFVDTVCVCFVWCFRYSLLVFVFGVRFFSFFVLQNRKGTHHKATISNHHLHAFWCHFPVRQATHGRLIFRRKKKSRDTSHLHQFLSNPAPCGIFFFCRVGMVVCVVAFLYGQARLSQAFELQCWLQDFPRNI